jgi:NAD-dependent dihydropyrimidine dehydrogenase PreA subunit
VRGRAPIATRPPSRLVAGAAAARLPVVPSVSRAIAGTGGDAAGSNATRQAEESFQMTYVIAEPCVDVMDQACVAVCPVDCIHFEQGTDRTLYIDPNECIDCGACEPECPVNAIYPEESLPAGWAGYTELNAVWFTDKAAARAMLETLKPA